MIIYFSLKHKHMHLSIFFSFFNFLIKKKEMKLSFYLIFILISCFWVKDVFGIGKCAFVTLIAGPDPEFIDGAVVLGKSLTKVKSELEIDMILLHKRGLNMIQYDLLIGEGRWTLKELTIEISQPPGHVYKRRFENMYDKLAIFSLIDYDTIVYIDADALVTENIDELCNLNVGVGMVSRGPAANTGVMVVKPNLATFAKLVDAVTTLKPNYPTNDQGLINIIYKSFFRCPYIDPLKDNMDDLEYSECARIPAIYNGDVLLHAVQGSKWPYDPDTFDFSHPKIIHYNFGDIKPWFWYSQILAPNVNKWWAVKNDPIFKRDDVIIPEQALAMAYLILFVGIVLVLPNKYYSNFIHEHLYEPLSYYPLGLIVVYLLLNLGVCVMSFYVTSIFVFSPVINTSLFIVVYCNFMRIILYNHLPWRSELIVYPIILALFSIFYIMHHMEEELTFFVRIGILVWLLIESHWLIGWTAFIRHILEPLCKNYKKAQKEANHIN